MTTAYPLAPASLAETGAPATRADARPLWRRIVDAVANAQQQRAEREIAKFIALRGGTFSDAAEREIELHYLSPRLF